MSIQCVVCTVYLSHSSFWAFFHFSFCFPPSSLFIIHGVSCGPSVGQDLGRSNRVGPLPQDEGNSQKEERGRKDGRCAYGNGGYKKHGQLVSTTPYCKSVRFPEEKKKASYFLGCWFPPLGVFLCFLYSSLLSPFSSSPSAYILPYSPYFHISRCYSSRPPDYAVPRVPARLHRIYTIPLRSCTPCVASYPAPASSVPCQQSQ